MIVRWLLNVQLQICQANSCVKKPSSTIYIVIHKNEWGVRQHRATTHGSLWISMECLLRYENKAFCSGYNVPTRNIHKMSWTCKECGTLKTRSPLMVSYNAFCIITSCAILWIAEQIRRLSPENRHQYTEEIKIG